MARASAAAPAEGAPLVVIRTAYALPSGRAAAFDADGEQLAAYAGPLGEVGPRILADAPADGVAWFVASNGALVPVDRAGWEQYLRFWRLGEAVAAAEKRARGRGRKRRRRPIVAWQIPLPPTWPSPHWLL